jgi:hypothetical protein
MTQYNEKDVKLARKLGYTLYLPTEQKSDTVAVVLGWMGTTDRYLRHYANYYSQKLGMTCVTFIAPGFQFWSSWYAQYIAKNFLLYLQNTLQCEKIVVHGMSNNGGFLWSNMLHIIETESEFSHFKDRILGYIAEAHPGFNAADTRAIDVLVGRAISPWEEQELAKTGTKKPEPHRGLMYYWGVFVAFVMAWIYRLKYSGASKDPKTYFNSVYANQLGGELNASWPILALYSEEDFIVPAEMVEMFWTEVGKKGKEDVELCKFSGNFAHHMKILMKHGDEYGKKIAGFLKKIKA